jgi:hypothetical protein
VMIGSEAAGAFLGAITAIGFGIDGEGAAMTVLFQSLVIT